MTKFVFQWSRCTEFGAFLMAVNSRPILATKSTPRGRAEPHFASHPACTFRPIFRPVFCAPARRFLPHDRPRKNCCPHTNKLGPPAGFAIQQLPARPRPHEKYNHQTHRSSTPHFYPCSYPLCLHIRPFSCILKAVDPRTGRCSF